MYVSRRIGGQSTLLAMTLASAIFMMTGCGGSNSSQSGNNATATPTFTPGAGSYNASQTVTIATTSPGAVLYCTTDGTTPTTSSPQCSQPTTVFKTEFLQAIAVAHGMAPSAVASAGYTINLNAAPTPTFNPAGGSYAAAQNVTISDSAMGANIYYTLDGTVPTVNSTLYTGPISVAKSATLSAIAVVSGLSNSGVQSATYVIGQGVAIPVITPTGGTFNAATPVTITDATAGAIIYYTVDGSTPSASSTPYTAPISVASSETINAIAATPNGSSSIATAAFTISLTAAASPTFNPAAGTYSSAQTVTLSDATAGATIFYTVDGSTPTNGSTAYSGTAINVGASETIKAVATAPGFSASAVSSAAYTINVTVAQPTFSPVGGTYTSAQQVTLSDTTPGALIYYTTDGSPATTSSTPYNSSSPIPVAATETINAIAAVGSDVSTMASASYTINLGPSFSGTVLSGTSPVNGATVQMYAAGQTGYGSTATPLLSTSVKTDPTGAFTFTYNCPAAPGDLVYIVASGGSTGNGGSNSALNFMTALGPCNGTLPKTAVVDEVTTVASAYALSQFMTGATNVGSSAANYEKGTTSAPGLANAFATVTNLVDLTTGQALDHTPGYPANLVNDPQVLNNSTVPQARINTLANILHACAGDGSGCSNLFSAATPSSGAAPADTLQAILNIAQNPGNNPTPVFNVATGTGPYTPVLSAPPADWTLALTFTGGGLGFAPGIKVPFANGSQTGQFLNTAMAVDATGNVWVTGFNNNGAGGSFTPDVASGMIAEFSNLGAPLTPASSFTAGTPAVGSYGGNIPIKGGTGGSNAGTIAAHGIAFDPSGNAWIVGGTGSAEVNGQTAGALTEISPSMSVVIADVQLGQNFPGPVVIDGVGNVWVQGLTSAGTVGVNKYDGTGKLLASNDGTATDGLGYFYLQSLTLDSNATALFGSDALLGLMYQINPKDDSNTIDYYASSFAGQFTPLVAGSADPATGNAGNVYGCSDVGGQTLDVFNVSSTQILATHPMPPTGRGCGNQMVMDGAGHIFAVTGSTGSTITPGIIDEFAVSSSGLTLISPQTTGYTGTSPGESPTINADPNAVSVNAAASGVATGGVIGAAIDGSGNFWVLNADSGTAASTGNALVEYIGLAAPVVTPTSLAIQFGQVGVRP